LLKYINEIDNLNLFQGLEDIMPQDVVLAKSVRDFFFQPDGKIELAKLDSFIQQHSDALFQ